jgi:hypothetical protein
MTKQSRCRADPIKKTFLSPPHKSPDLLPGSCTLSVGANVNQLLNQF